ncbi:hypothetical protein L211DRAFT_80808 [Terfezia boudieri ATCC MYA-4762]|uniref:CHAT domain-containing protein n=1 Tax=Terfezia boudieri ATCC MYA-4762 TaxID=1051890 RepID=A0A3N4LCL1_9PEZI|nr:hypothetical protein L211DRAFT_80808 [Terfezia boudieri ATCC MYA-4762]
MASNQGNNASNVKLRLVEAAIRQGQRAMETTPEGYPTRPGKLSNLANHLSSRYKQTGDLHDLDTAIARLEEAVQAAPEDHPDRAACLNNLGGNLSSRYNRTGNLQDLEAAIARSEAAVEATPEDHPDRAGWLNNLGSHYSRRYERTGNLQDLEAAIARSEAAVEATPEDHPARAGRLNNLGSHYSSRYERTGNLQDLEAAISRSEAAVEATPEDHPDRAAMLYNLGNCFSNRYERTGNLQDVDTTVGLFFAAWSVITAPILIRLQGAYAAAQRLALIPSIQDLSRACSLLRDSIHLLPLLTSRSLQREGQQHVLAQLTGLVSLAVSVSLVVEGSPLEALRLQELGRSVTNGQLLDYRSDISDLMEHHPKLAEEFDSLRQQLDSPLPVLESVDMSIHQLQCAQESTICRRNQTAKDFENILLQIREKPGFQNFLLAQSEAHLLSAAHRGPIVILNATSLRSDAILVTRTNVTSISLPSLSHPLLVKYCTGNTYLTDNILLREFLEWLWKGAVQPVLRELGFYPKTVDPLPRIWWIGVGLMAMVPIHAATKFKHGKVKMTTLQYCLVSYTSTIKALQYSRTRPCQQNASMLIVTMPTTPGESPLSGVSKEAEGIKHIRDFSTVEIVEWPSAAHVLKVLPAYTIAHFACHRVSSNNPADSHLLLRKELSGEVDKLHVKDIAALKLPAAKLAYLSAGSTARTASSRLVDEVTHIVSTFHVAGFKHVIGTLWESQDEACQKMALDFYTELGTGDDVAASYRTAIMKLMKQKPLQPLYWAPFIHFGA